MDEASSVGSIDLTPHHCFKYLKNFTAHFACFCNSELEKEHTDITVDTLVLRHLVLSMRARANKSMRQLNRWIYLLKQFFWDFGILRDFKAPFNSE